MGVRAGLLWCWGSAGMVHAMHLAEKHAMRRSSLVCVSGRVVRFFCLQHAVILCASCSVPLHSGRALPDNVRPDMPLFQESS